MYIKANVEDVDLIFSTIKIEGEKSIRKVLADYFINNVRSP